MYDHNTSSVYLHTQSKSQGLTNESAYLQVQWLLVDISGKIALT